MFSVLTKSMIRKTAGQHVVHSLGKWQQPIVHALNAHFCPKTAEICAATKIEYTLCPLAHILSFSHTNLQINLQINLQMMLQCAWWQCFARNKNGARSAGEIWYHQRELNSCLSLERAAS